VGPTDAKTENNLGLSLEAENQTDAAVTAYRKAIKLDQAAEVHSEQPYLNLGVLLTKSNRAAEALELLQQAARMAPSSNRARYELGKAYFELGEFAKAEPELEAAIHIEPKSRESHYLLGRIYQRLGKAERAAQEFKITESLVRVRDPGESGMAAAPGPGAP
jgi:Tfp pilus assembly protein PilF